MADPICRWRNSSIKQLMEFNSLLPLNVTSKKEGREHVEALWQILGGEDFFTTPYQLAAQMGTYYEDNEYLYPKFDKYLSIEEAANYMHTWGENYYSPNPYTKSIKNVRPVVINKFLVNYAQTGLNPTFTDALREMFGDNVIGNTDILKNMLNTFSEVNINGEDIVSVKPVAQGKYYKDEEIYPSVDANDKKEFFEHFGKERCLKPVGIKNNLPLQQIFYGAPGTGKSHTVDGTCKKYTHFRTTFHPDSDYSTFVGCYKPTMASAERIYNHGELINRLSKIKLTGTSYPCQKWASRYWESIKSMSTDDIKSILSACGFTDSMTTEVSKSIAVGEEFASNGTTNQITYAFTPQAFTHAYLEAWRKFEKNEPVLLVIEEINRGNCAQIFGDLFQLLDRNKEGYSTYPIVPDTDLGSYIGKHGLNVHNAILKKDDGTTEDISEVINSGKKLVLPPNLHIWATMNTSDQSLFPIDSAFKRRWDWTYVPIKYKNTEWKVVLSDNSRCSWTELQTKLNDLIYDATESEDKMLGDWFVKADVKNEITEEQLVGKIIFYLWNDVAKVDAGTLFDLEVAEKRGKNKRVTFSDFYERDGKTNTPIVKEWLTKIGITINEANPADDGMEDDDDPGENVPERVSDTNMPYRVTFPDGEVICNGNGWDTYVAALRKIGLDKALPYGEIFHRKNKTLPLITTKRIPDDGIYRYYDVDGYYVLSGTDSQHRLLKRMNKDLNLGLTIE